MSAVDVPGETQLNVEDQVVLMRQRFRALTAGEDEGLARFELRWPPMPPGLDWRTRWLIGWLLRCLESMRLKKPDRWPAALRGSSARARARPYLIWALGADKDTVRRACRGFDDLGEALPGFVPVLVTDVPDFAFFSRLGWLVEYVPELPGAGGSYAARKAQFIARLYSDAPVVPVGVGLHAEEHADEIRRLVLNA
jgi:hypothetical protein